MQRIAGKGRGKRKQHGWGGEGVHSWELKRNLPGGSISKRNLRAVSPLRPFLLGCGSSPGSPTSVWGHLSVGSGAARSSQQGQELGLALYQLLILSLWGGGGAHGTEGNCGPGQTDVQPAFQLCTQPRWVQWGQG